MAANKAEIREQIYRDLRKRIFRGDLHCGQRMVETKIAQDYSVNKAHVREVLQLLQNDGLVTHEPMKGFFVLGIAKEDLLEIAKIREMLEKAIFEDFLANARDEDIEAAKLFTKRKIALLQAGLKEEAFKETSATFDKIYECTTYRRMVVMLRQYREYIDLMITKAFDLPDDVEKTIRNSTLLYEVLDRRDYELAQEWIHIRYTNAVYKIGRSPVYPRAADRK